MPDFWCYLINVIYLVALVVLVLAAARAARLASKDDITAPLRLWIDRKRGENSFWSALMWCFWCSGVWLSGLLTAMALSTAVIWDHWPIGLAAATWIPLTLAISYGGSRLVDLEGE
jgi:hypothetical protein